VSGNLGYSFMDRQSIAAKIGERLWPTLRLMLTAQLIAIAIAVPVGVMSAIKQYSLLDYSATVLGFAAISCLVFLSLAGIYVFALLLPILPARGMVDRRARAAIADSLWHLVAAGVVLGLPRQHPSSATPDPASRSDPAGLRSSARAKGCVSRP